MSATQVFIEGVGLNGPGLPDWPTACAVLAGQAAHVSQPTTLAAPTGLPPAERRRVGNLVKLALGVASEAVAASGQPADTLASVFASSSGDGDICHALCEALAGDRLISPTRFTNSVHNAPSGFWGIVSQAVMPSGTLCAYDGSFGAGLLDALTQASVDGRTVLLVSYDAPYPSPLSEARPVREAMGVGLVLSPARTSRSLASLRVALCDAPPDVLPVASLEALRQGIPAGRALPLLQALASLPGKPAQRVVLDYLNGRQLALEVQACN